MTDRRLRRGAFIGAEAMLRSAAKRLLSANEPELLAHAQWVHREVRERALGRKLRLLAGPYLFVHLHGTHRGERIRAFRKAWATACKKAGVAGRLRHDFRRTAQSRSVERGVSKYVESHDTVD